MTTHTSQRFCLRWNNHQSNLLSVFDQLLHDESFVDVTLAVEGQLLRAHKMVLSACSPYFQALFIGHPDKHPIVILKDVPFADMRCLLDFMYRGEVSVDQDRLTAFLKVAESLRIKGLTEVNEEKRDLPSIANSLLNNNNSNSQSMSNQQPPPNLHRIHLTQPSRQTNSPSSFNHPLLGSALLGSKRKRGRPRKLSGSSDTPSINSPEQDMSYDTDNRHLIGSNMSDSSYGIHGPPDLLEVNMSDHGQTSPSLCDEQREPSPDIDSPMYDQSGDDSMQMDETLIKKEYPDCLPGSSRDCDSPLQIRDTIGGASRSKSQTPTNTTERFPDLPLLRLVPKSELLAVFRKDTSPKGTPRNGDNENNNHLNSTPNFNNNIKFSPPSHLMSSSSLTAGGICYQENTTTSLKQPAQQPQQQQQPASSRRRVRRRATSSSDPAEQLTEMSVRGLNLFRYASIDAGVYKCMECAKTDVVKTFKNKYSFQRHAFLYHEGCQRKVFPCPVCGKEFSRPDKMKNHMKTVHDCFMPKECIFPPPPIPFFLTPP